MNKSEIFISLSLHNESTDTEMAWEEHEVIINIKNIILFNIYFIIDYFLYLNQN